MRQLPLAIGHGGGNAVGVDPQAAHAEGGAGAEATDRQLRVLRVVLAVEGRDPGNAGQALGDIDLGAIAVGVQVHGGHGAGTSMSWTLRRRVALTSTVSS